MRERERSRWEFFWFDLVCFLTFYFNSRVCIKGNYMIAKEAKNRCCCLVKKKFFLQLSCMIYWIPWLLVKQGIISIYVPIKVIGYILSNCCSKLYSVQIWLWYRKYDTIIHMNIMHINVSCFVRLGPVWYMELDRIMILD